MTADGGDSLFEQLERELHWQTTEHRLKFPLWHYSSDAGLRGILQTRELWASHFACMNDDRELTMPEDFLTEEIAALAAELERTAPKDGARLRHFLKALEPLKLSSRVETHAFLGSFCDDGDYVPNWREYGDGGAGYSIGISHLPEAGENFDADLGYFPLKMGYSEAEFRAAVRARITDNLQRLRAFAAARGLQGTSALDSSFATLMLRAMAGLSVTFKHGTFDFERESRIVVVQMHPKRDYVLQMRRGKKRVLFYVRIPLATSPALLPVSKVYVGPLREGREERRARAVELLGELGYPNPEGMVLDSTCSLN